MFENSVERVSDGAHHLIVDMLPCIFTRRQVEGVPAQPLVVEVSGCGRSF